MPQVSNARRIWFTALAVLVFIWCSVSVYWLLVDQIYANTQTGTKGVPRWWASLLLRRDVQSLLIGLSVAALPTLFLSLSSHNSPIMLRDRRILVAAIIFSCCGTFSWWLADLDAHVGIFAFPEQRVEQLMYWDQIQIEMRSEHEVSWLWLLTPIILTTAFVIFGAWRRAVRDAMLEPVDEDE